MEKIQENLIQASNTVKQGTKKKKSEPKGKKEISWMGRREKSEKEKRKNRLGDGALFFGRVHI